MKHTRLRTRGALRPTAALLLSGGMLFAATSAWAAPTPDSGPVAGGTAVTVDVPIAPAKFTQVSAGRFYTVALDQDGYAYAWGNNYCGQLGNGTTTESTVPVPVAGGHKFTSIEAGLEYTVALDENGNAYAWGCNYYGRFGNGTTTNSAVPVPVAEGHTFTSIVAGSAQTVAIDKDGNVYRWGSLDETTSASKPVLVPGGNTFTRIGAGPATLLTIGQDGQAYAWGDNSRGERGDGTDTSAWVTDPVPLAGGNSFTEVAGGWSHSVALDQDGNAYGWGDNSWGELGDGGVSPNTNTPVPVVGGHTFTSITAGAGLTAALTEDGKAYAWGENSMGQLGTGTFGAINTFSPTPAAVTGGHTFSAISSGWFHTVALGTDGIAYTWGNNDHGELGDGTTTGRAAPTAVEIPRTVVTKVTFGGVPADAASFAEVSTGEWTVDTPAHAAGPVEVVIEYTVGGVAQTPLVYTDGFSYLEAPALTDPVDANVACDAEASFTTQVTAGYPKAAPVWEESTDDGKTWSATNGTVSADGLTLTVTASKSLAGTLYRASATNSEGSTASAPAALTVSCAMIDDDDAGDSPTKRKPAETVLAQTGAPSAAGIITLGVVMALLGSALVGSSIIARRMI